MQLAQIDLNLLKLMLILLEEGSVSRAAYQLNLSQSAVSKQLTKLREQVGSALKDPLFIKAGTGLKATAKAQAMEQPLREWLRLYCQMMVPNHFDPQQDEREFKISIAENAFPVVVPGFMQSLTQAAPKLKLNIAKTHSKSLQLVEQSQLDLLIIARDTDLRAGFPWHINHLPEVPRVALFEDENVCLVRKNHPVLTHPWNLESFLSLSRIKISVEEQTRWLLDEVLLAQGKESPDMAVVADFHSAALLAQHSDMSMICTSAFANQLCERYELKMLPMPFHLGPAKYFMLWPETQETNPAHIWLREFIQKKCLESVKINPPAPLDS